jgi:hypothetical protein
VQYWPVVLGDRGHGAAGMCGIECRGARAAGSDCADRNRPRQHSERAQIVLASADRHSPQWVAQSISVSRPTVWRWQQRFAESGVDGLLRDKTRKPGKMPIDRRGNQGADGGADLHRAVARSHSLDRPGDGQGHRHLPGFSAAHLAGAQTAAASAAHVQAFARPRLCRQAHRCRRALCRSAGPRCGAVDR